jgi:glucose/mannose transport system substrate-binding protein
MGAAWLLACSGDHTLGHYPASTCDLAEPPAEVSDTPLSIATFWPADSQERDAFQTLVEQVDTRRYFVSTQQMSTRVATQMHIDDAFESQQLPDVFQVNGGSDVLRWVEGRPPETTDVCALDSLSERYGWQDSYFRAALAPLTCEDKLYGLPVGIHHLNVLFFNREVFAELDELARARGAKLLPPAELKSAYQLLEQLELVAQLDATTTSGAELIPLAVGTRDEWPLTIVAFENVLLSLDHEAYETLWMGGLEGDDGTRASELRARLSETLALLRELYRFSNVTEELSWQAALRQVGAGEALMTITGDWGWAQLGAEAIAKVETATFPGTAGTFVYTPDSFAVPRELKKNGFPARSFLHDVVEDKAALIAFSKAKHSIPPRHDMAEELAALGSDSLLSAYREFARCDESPESCKLLLAVSGLAPPPGVDPCFDEMDALLALAVTGRAATREPLEPPLCDETFPSSSAQAEKRLIDRLIRVAEQRFAAQCR